MICIVISSFIICKLIPSCNSLCNLYHKRHVCPVVECVYTEIILSILKSTITEVCKY